ncbi:transposase family protein [Thomasclavelia cocleata]|uniref:transposase family protein n=1 Tax=Thomasclavelia cocleata TaxID=69824 RepID=UPI0024302442|nr:transposase family protein [Thomasclavelia cocleata]
MVKELDINYEETDLSVLNNFVTIVKRLDDTRVQYKVRHNMSDIIIITLLGILSNANSWNEIHCFVISYGTWLKSFLELLSGILSHDTIQRVIAIINPSTLYTGTIKYLINLIDNLSISTKEKDVKNMDGKTINRSSRSELITSKFCQQM